MTWSVAKPLSTDFSLSRVRSGGPYIKAISHHIFLNLRSFLYGEERRIYLCNISVFIKVVKVVQKEVPERPEREVS